MDHATYTVVPRGEAIPIHDLGGAVVWWLWLWRCWCVRGVWWVGGLVPYPAVLTLRFLL
jgi:hypothetical protein